VVELVQDGGGVLPGVAGGVEAAGGVVGVAEAGERVGFRYGKASWTGKQRAVEVPCGVPLALGWLEAAGQTTSGRGDADPGTKVAGA
jgi:hypothetical protein